MGDSKKHAVFNVGGPPSNAYEKGRHYSVERVTHNHVGPLYQSFANVVRDEGPRRGGLVPIGR
ncbi:hypothetical protein CK203_050932 [Vitis vinifera]|uniref:Uncharacterized protein n=1 Tax=Vitis vinifera TaxID=29760 RepID=A0A438GQV1_VITVI|nr:hypothetical protein CK203_050932 [Vitis vinifera]